MALSESQKFRLRSLLYGKLHIFSLCNTKNPEKSKIQRSNMETDVKVENKR
jgi:hypothetical protein